MTTGGGDEAEVIFEVDCCMLTKRAAANNSPLCNVAGFGFGFGDVAVGVGVEAEAEA